jgi:hypothetical protein
MINLRTLEVYIRIVILEYIFYYKASQGYFDDLYTEIGKIKKGDKKEFQKRYYFSFFITASYVSRIKSATYRGGIRSSCK